eukprot:scpid100821/ scgid29280/ 
MARDGCLGGLCRRRTINTRMKMATRTNAPPAEPNASGSGKHSGVGAAVAVALALAGTVPLTDGNELVEMAVSGTGDVSASLVVALLLSVLFVAVLLFSVWGEGDVPFMSEVCAAVVTEVDDDSEVWDPEAEAGDDTKPLVSALLVAVLLFTVWGEGDLPLMSEVGAAVVTEVDVWDPVAIAGDGTKPLEFVVGDAVGIVVNFVIVPWNLVVVTY